MARNCPRSKEKDVLLESGSPSRWGLGKTYGPLAGRGDPGGADGTHRKRSGRRVFGETLTQPSRPTQRSAALKGKQRDPRTQQRPGCRLGHCGGLLEGPFERELFREDLRLELIEFPFVQEEPRDVAFGPGGKIRRFRDPARGSSRALLGFDRKGYLRWRPMYREQLLSAGARVALLPLDKGCRLETQLHVWWGVLAHDPHRFVVVFEAGHSTGCGIELGQRRGWALDQRHRIWRQQTNGYAQGNQQEQ